MGVESDARIRLEGRLETVERLAGLFEVVPAYVRDRQWAVAQRALEQLASAESSAAIAAVRKMAGEFPELGILLGRLERARFRAERAVRAAARTRGVIDVDARAELGQLLADEVLYEARLRSPLSGLMVPLYGLIAVAGLLTWHDSAAWVGVLMLAAFVTALGLVHGGSVFVLVTKDRLVVNRLIVPLDRVVRIQTDCLERYRPWQYVLGIRTERSSHSARLPWIPQELVSALAEAGVAIDRFEWPYGGQHFNHRERFKS